MATKTIKTRIKNRFDTLPNWEKQGVELLPGEIALVKVTTQKLDETTGDVVNVPAVLLKVGEATSATDSTPVAFSNLPWLSALAADVYDWAKKGTANEVPISIKKGTETTATPGNLESWLKTTYDTGVTNAAAISNLNNLLTGTESTDGTIADRIKKAITAAINGLDSTNSTNSSGNFVKAVTQTNGIVDIQYGNIALDDIKSHLTTANIDAGGNKTLAKALEELNSRVTSTLSALEVKAEGTGSFVSGLSYDGSTGTITYTKSNITVDNLPTDIPGENLKAGSVTTTQIATNTITDTNVDKISASKIEVTPKTANTEAKMLPERFEEIEAKIATINKAIDGGVHFIGTVNSLPSASNNGDVVVCGQKEYIYVKLEDAEGRWEELGDLSRVGALETQIDAMDVTAPSDITNKFVSKVEQTDGKIEVTYTQPTSANVSHSGSTVKQALEKLSADKANAADVYTKNETGTQITNAISGLTHTDSGSGSYVTNVTQSAGKVTVTKGNLPTADTSTSGIVQLSDTTITENPTSKKAATEKAVVTVNNTVRANAQNISTIQGNYVRFNSTDQKLYVGKDGSEEIIFDCGGAE